MLYRKYRPQKFSEVIGQEFIKITIQNEISSGKIAHAYLFCGPRAVGKTTTARLLAKALNCENRQKGESEPCNKCVSCKDIIDGRSLDIIEIDAASHTGVDNVRENIIANAQTGATSVDKYKIFIIDEVHMLSNSAFNALLKILEEPPKKTIFILATTEIHKLLPTIISRCQRFDFKKINLGEMVERLAWISKQEKAEVDEEVLKKIAYFSEGCQRDSESLLSQVLSLSQSGKKISMEQAQLVLPRSNFVGVFEFIEYLINKDTKGAIELVNRLADEGIDLGQFNQDLIEFLRKMLLVKINNDLGDFSIELDNEKQKKVKELIKNSEFTELAKIIELLLEKSYTFKDVSIAQLPLELVVVEFSKGKYVESIEQAITNKPQVEEKKNVEERGNSAAYSAPVMVKEASPKYETDSIAKVPAEKHKSIDIIEQTKEEAVEKKVCEDVFSNKNFTLEEVKNNWQSIIKEVSKSNHSLTYVLGASQPISVEKNVLKLGFKYKLHRDRVDNVQIRPDLEKCLSKVLDAKVVIESVVADIEDKVPQEDGFADEMLQTFGGKVVG